MCKLVLSIGLLLLTVAAARADETFTTVEVDWHDAKRNVDVPVKLYYPKDLKASAPVVIISHGLGGSREGLKYLGEYLAAHGYITVHPTHVGSDISLLRRGNGDMAQAIRAGFTPGQLNNRINDVSFVIDELERLNADPKSQFAGKLDLTKIAMAGHSFGAITTEAVAGAPMGRGKTPPADKRIKCAVALSPSSPRAGNAGAAFAKITLPMLHLTGTDDDMSSLGGINVEDRRTPFDNLNNSDQYLVILTGATHATLGGSTRGAKGDAKAMLAIYQRMTGEFLDAYLRGDENARAWLKNDAKAFVGNHGTYEMKIK